MPAADELGREGSLLPSAHRSHELFGELAADDLEQSLVWRRSLAAAVSLAGHVLEHHVDELGCPSRILHVPMLGIERAWRGPPPPDSFRPNRPSKAVGVALPRPTSRRPAAGTP